MPSLKNGESRGTCARWKYGMCSRAQASYIIRRYYKPVEHVYCGRCCEIMAFSGLLDKLWSGKTFDGYEPKEGNEWVLERNAYAESHPQSLSI